ncbi:unnamed protein product, partial [Didymodactylos carnosus]
METAQEYQAFSPSPKKLGGLTLLALCCLGLLGLILAGVIVIALIPVYLERHGINGPERESNIIQLIYNLPLSNTASIVSGEVPQSRYEVLQNILQQQLDNATSGSPAKKTQVKVINVIVQQPQSIEQEVKTRGTADLIYFADGMRFRKQNRDESSINHAAR